MRGRRGLVLGLLAGLIVIVSVVMLERPRIGLEVTSHPVGQTPVTRYALPGSDGPVVIVSHGFAGSRQMMGPWAQTLAQAGYRVHVFDYEGHGRHPLPMSGDVTSEDGTTRLLLDQTRAVIDAAREMEGSTDPVGLLGHSMATDIIARAAFDDGIGPVVGVSMFSLVVTADGPPDLLMISGAGEPRLRDWALEAVRQIAPEAEAGEMVSRDGLRRMAVVAPGVEHVSILHSRAGQAAALDWLDGFHERQSAVSPARTGPFLLLLLVALVALSAPLAARLPKGASGPLRLSRGRWAAILLLPGLAAPGLAILLNRDFLPVLVADHLALHLGLYGLIQLALLRAFGRAIGPILWVAAGALVLWGLGVFGVALDRYGANFWPVAPRGWIIAAIALGAVPFMLADARLVQRQALWLRVLIRLAFLGSLGFAVLLDFEGLFFLALIAPVIVLFYLIFGTMGRFVARQSGPAAAGLGLGLILAWALGVSFPLFSATGAL